MSHFAVFSRLILELCLKSSAIVGLPDQGVCGTGAKNFLAQKRNGTFRASAGRILFLVGGTHISSVDVKIIKLPLDEIRFESQFTEISW